MPLSRLKQLLTAEQGEGDRPYECQTCLSRFERRYQVCPECDGYDIRRVVWLEETRTVDER